MKLSIFAEVLDYFQVKLDALIVTFYYRSCIISRIGMQQHFITNVIGGFVIGKALKTLLHYVLILGSMKQELRANTWFNEARISIWKSLFMTYCFVYQMSYSDTIRETTITSDEHGKLIQTSRETVITSVIVMMCASIL